MMIKRFLLQFAVVLFLALVCFGGNYLLSYLGVSLGWSIFWAFTINIVLLVQALLLDEVFPGKHWLSAMQRIQLTMIIFCIGLMCWNAYLLNETAFVKKLRPAEISTIGQMKFADYRYFKIPGIELDQEAQIKSVEVTESSSGKKSYTAEFLIPLKNDSVFFPGKSVMLWLYDLRTSGNRSFGAFDDNAKLGDSTYAFFISEKNSSPEKTLDAEARSEEMGYGHAIIIELVDLNAPEKNTRWLFITHGIFLGIALVIIWLQRKAS